MKRALLTLLLRRIVPAALLDFDAQRAAVTEAIREHAISSAACTFLGGRS